MRKTDRKRILILIGIVVLAFFAGTRFFLWKKDVAYEKAHHRISKVEFEEYEAFGTKLGKVGRTYLNAKGEITESNAKKLMSKVKKICKEEKEKGTIESFEEAGGDLCITMSSGILYFFRIPQKGILASDTSVKPRIKVLEPTYSDIAVGSARGLAELDVGDGTWFSKDDLKPKNNAEMIKNTITEGEVSFEIDPDGYVKDWVINDNVTLSQMKSLSDYKVVIFEGHGAHGSRQGSGLVTGEYVRHWEDAQHYMEDLGDESIALTQEWWEDIDDPYEGKCIVTAKFFQKYLKNMQGGLVYLGACFSGKDSRLADAFLQKGADTVIGMKDTTNMSYEMDARAFIFRRLCKENDTVQGAVDLVRKKMKDSEAKEWAFGETIRSYPVVFTNEKKAENYKLQDYLFGNQTTSTAGTESTQATSENTQTSTQATSEASTEKEKYNYTVKFNNDGAPYHVSFVIFDHQGRDWSRTFRRRDNKVQGYYLDGGAYDLDGDGENEILVNRQIYGSTYGAADVLVYKISHGMLIKKLEITWDNASKYNSKYCDCLGATVQNGKLMVTFGKYGGGEETKEIKF